MIMKLQTYAHFATKFLAKKTAWLSLSGNTAFSRKVILEHFQFITITFSAIRKVKISSWQISKELTSTIRITRTLIMTLMGLGERVMLETRFIVQI